MNTPTIVCEQSVLRFDPWLSDTLERQVFELIADQIDACHSPVQLTELLNDLPSHNLFVYSRIPPSATDALSVLQQCGFYVVDTAMTLICDHFPDTPAITNSTQFSVRTAEPEDESPVVELARNSFQYSRFHSDPLIANESANTLKAQWIKSYFRRKRGDELVIALCDEKVVGFLLALEIPKGSVVIDLVAVDVQYRGLGVAKHMTSFLASLFPDVIRLQVGTQAANRAAWLCYQRMGFELVECHYVLHYHQS